MHHTLSVVDLGISSVLGVTEDASRLILVSPNTHKLRNEIYVQIKGVPNCGGFIFSYMNVVYNFQRNSWPGDHFIKVAEQSIRWE